MEIAIRNIGNSKGVVLPKPLRAGWSEAAAALSAQGGDALLMGEFGNSDDEALTTLQEVFAA